MSHGRDNTALVADVEGLDVYYGRDGKGFLIVSSQGNFSYALFDREAPHAYLFFFSSRRRHTRLTCDWSSDVCSSDLKAIGDRLVARRVADEARVPLDRLGQQRGQVVD